MWNYAKQLYFQEKQGFYLQEAHSLVRQVDFVQSRFGQSIQWQCSRETPYQTVCGDVDSFCHAIRVKWAGMYKVTGTEELFIAHHNKKFRLFKQCVENDGQRKETMVDPRIASSTASFVFVYK